VAEHTSDGVDEGVLLATHWLKHQAAHDIAQALLRLCNRVSHANNLVHDIAN
jgi:hypothetical protein